MAVLPPLALFLALGMTATVSAQNKDRLDYSIIGSISMDRKPNYFWAMGAPKTQDLLLKLAGGSLDEAAAAICLKDSSASLGDLLELRLIRKEKGRIYLNFALFTAKDIDRVLTISEPFGRALAQAILLHKGEIERILKAYDIRGVDKKVLAYVVLGCVSLDWDGLAITERKGYRKATDFKPDGKYVPHAEETSKHSVKSLYWGSRVKSSAKFHLATFGDDDAKRLNLPPEFAEALAKMLFSLGESPKSKSELIKDGVSPLDAERLPPILVALDYAEIRDGRYFAKAPLLTQRHADMVNKLRTLSEKIMSEWLEANYPRIKSDLADLSMAKAGVPFEEGFTMIWHYIFGIANRSLVEAGLFADPYAEGRKFPGYIPFLYDIELKEE